MKALLIFCAVVAILGIPFGSVTWPSAIIEFGAGIPNVMVGGWEVSISLGQAILHKPSLLLWILLAVGAIGYIATREQIVSTLMKLLVNTFIIGNLLLAGVCYLVMYLSGDWKGIELGHMFLAIALAFTLYRNPGLVDQAARDRLVNDAQPAGHGLVA